MDRDQTEGETEFKLISLAEIDVQTIEGMDSSALKEALKSVLRNEPSVADHQDHGSHSNSNTNI